MAAPRCELQRPRTNYLALFWHPQAALPTLSSSQAPVVPELTVHRIWLSTKPRNATDVSLITQLSGASGVVASKASTSRLCCHRSL